MSWFTSMLISLFVLIGLADYPIVATLVASAVLCGYCAHVLSERIAGFVLLYPILCLWLAEGFTVYTFFEVGDGPAYFAVMETVVPRLVTQNYQSLAAIMALAGPKYLNVGFLPTALLPPFFFDNPDSVVYQLMQAYVHVALVSLLLTLTMRWDVVQESYRVPVFLFLLLSPGYLAMLSYPTRHHVTSFAVFLVFIGFEACVRQLAVGRLVTLFVALVLLFFCKAGLLLLVLLYVFFRLYNPAYKLLTLGLGALILGVISYLYDYVRLLYDTRFASETIGVFRDASLGPLMPLYKYVMAIVSPFPYYKYGVVVNTIAYGGNWLLLLLFIPAGTIGLWMLYRMIRNSVKLWAYDQDTRRLFAYGSIMSLSILGGSTGFLMYILIFMPFFAPLFRINDYNVSLISVLLSLLLLNFAVLVLNEESLFDFL